MQLGVLPYINTLPVTWGLQSGAIPWPGTLSVDIPSRLSQRLVSGELPISLISSAAYLRHQAQLTLLRGLSVSAQGPVSSVILFTRLPRSEVRRVAVTPDTVTSVAVLQGLFGALWNHPLNTQVMTGELEDLLEEVGAVLWIGDQALLRVHHPPDGVQMLDVGELWWQWCGLPLPFAVWACRKDWAEQQPDQLALAQRLLLASKAWGRAHPDRVRAEAGRRLALSANALDDYYRLLNYDLSHRHLLGLAELPGLLKLSLRALATAAKV